MYWLDALYRLVRWGIRGVRTEDYRAICQRCQRTGQAHWEFRGCLRFERSSQLNWCWCPGCGIDLVGQANALLDGACGPDELVWYKCACGQHSVWNFNHITPFVVKKGPWLEGNVVPLR